MSRTQSGGGSRLATLPKVVRRMDRCEGVHVVPQKKRVIVTPFYPVKLKGGSRTRPFRDLKNPFYYGPLEWVPTSVHGNPKLPNGWTWEDWRNPSNHPAWPEAYVEEVEEHNVVLLHKARLPWDVDRDGVPKVLHRKLSIPNGYEAIWKTPVDEHPLEEMHRQRRADDRMMNVIITARDSETGTGKTTLAVELAKRWDENGWSAEKATLSPSQYQDMYHEVGEGSVIILDEAEQAADNRRSMSDQNLTLTHLWATMRFKQVSSIITLPTVTMLDKRLKELADVRIHVVSRGFAKVYKVKVEDTGEHNVFEKQIAYLFWGSMDDDEDYQALSKKKAERMEDYSVADDGDEEVVDPAEIERTKRNQMIRRMDESDELTQEEIAEIVGLSRSAVSRIANA